MLLKDICLLITKGTTPSTLGFKFQKEGINFLKVECIDKNGSLITNKIEHISQDCHSKMKRSQLFENDVLITIAGALGRTIVINKNVIPANINQAIAILRPNCNLIIPRYLHYYLSTDKMSKIINSYNAQSAQPNINLTQLGELEIDIKTKEEQNHIVNTIGSIDDLIEKYNKLTQKISDLLKVIFKKYYLKANINKTLSECANQIICGKTPSTKEEINWGHDIPFITIPDMHNSVYLTKYERFLSLKGANSQKNKFLPKNSICVSCIATPGLVSLTSEKCQTNQQINSIICKNVISPYYLYLLLNTEEMKQLIINLGSGGSTTYNLNKNSFASINIKLLNSIDMEKFDKSINPLFDLILDYNNKINYLNKLKQQHLKKFFG